MAAANFTTGLCKKGNRVGVMLTDALLEWILIVLLLANGVFSYVISKFAAFFGLTPPCFLCSRLGVDRLFEPCGGTQSLCRVLCDTHAKEVSRLGYCGAHRQLVEAGDLCEDCAVSAPVKAPVALSWMQRSELGEKDLVCACCGIALESGFYSASFLRPRPSLSGSDYVCKPQDVGTGNEDTVLMPKEIEKADLKQEDREEGPLIEFFNKKPLVEDDSIRVMDRCVDNVGGDDRLASFESTDLVGMARVAVLPQFNGEGKQNVDHWPVERDTRSVDTAVDAKEELVVASDDDKVDAVLNEMIHDEIAASVISPASPEEKFNGEMGEMEMEEGFTGQQYIALEEDDKLKDMEGDHEISIGSEISEEKPVEQAELNQQLISVSMDYGENIMETSNRTTDMGKEDIDASEDTFPSLFQFSPGAEATLQMLANRHNQVVEERAPDRPTHTELSKELISISMDCGENITETMNGSTDTGKEDIELDASEDTSPSLFQFSPEPAETTLPRLAHGHNQVEEERAPDRPIHTELSKELISISMDCGENITETLKGSTETGKEDIELDASADFSSLFQFSPEPAETTLPRLTHEHNEVEEERAPDTPTHIEGIGDLPKLFVSKGKESCTESVDESVATISSEMDVSEPLTADQLKYALIASRKSLNALYAELENERSAAAIAADETMAMINRLQEQKAAMQMEAVQYQRLLEEQSEYDQEALQMLNDLVAKREKEKQDLERELELYRQKVNLYEAKERRKVSRHKADEQNGSSSASSSAEDSDDHSPSFFEGDESAHGLNGSNNSIPTDAVLQETARHLVTLDDSLADFEEERLSILEQLKVLEERLFDLEDDESGEHLLEESNVNNAAYDLSDEKDSISKHCCERKSAIHKGKRLLPLFDDVSLENGNDLSKKLGATGDSSPNLALELEKEQDKLLISDEINDVYERLQALEADGEFLKHCIRSLNKGGKGLDLLQEILQHLRELRRIEQQARSSGELSLHYLHPYTD